MVRPTRFASVCLCVVALIWFVPYIYAKAGRGERFQQSGLFSPIQKQFIIWESGPDSVSYKSEAGLEYPLRKAHSLLPFMFAGNVNKWGGFPLTIDGRTFSYDEAQLARRSSRISGFTVNAPLPVLHVLLESDPEGAHLDLPPDVLAVLDGGLRFINAADGAVNEEKSKIFNKAAKDAGVVFPLTSFASNPSPLKEFDEGAFLIDGAGKLFQLKMVKGAPLCRDTGLIVPGTPRYLEVAEHTAREYYGLVATQDALYLNMYGDKLQKLPLPSYNADVNSVSLAVDPLYRSITVQNVVERPAAPARFLATDVSYNTVHTFERPMPEEIVTRQRLLDMGLSLLTPWRLQQYEGGTGKLGFYLSPTPSMVCLFGGILLALLGRWISQRRAGRAIHPAEVMLIAFTGLPGLAALIFFGPLCDARRPVSQ